MCTKHNNPRPGIALEAGAAHREDHESWTRRQFVTTLGLTGLGTLVAGQLPARAVLGAPLIHPLAAADSDRILVIIQLEGGNDGLNTVIPVDDDRYYRNRPTLGIPKTAALDVGQAFGLHPSLADLVPHLADGQMEIVHAVGYDNPDLSHFRSTDIWVSASDSNRSVPSGWIGRGVETNWPEIIANPPSSPLAVQIGGASMMFRGDQTTVGASFRDAEQLERLASGGVSYDPLDVPDTRYGHLMALARDLANQSYRYAGALTSAATTGTNRVAYPDNALSEQLSMVARLIAGGLGARVYHVNLTGFDTHALQADIHAQLLTDFAGATTAFQQDLEAAGRADDVLMMTFSEFGRTVLENGARGTDHATVAPIFLLGKGVAGPSYGVMPDLDVVNVFGDLEHIIDFRRVYATVLEQWLKIPAPLVDSVLSRSFERLDLFSAYVGTEGRELPDAFHIGQPYPNPAQGVVRLPVRLQRGGRLRLAVYDAVGRQVTRAEASWMGPGETEIPIDLTGLPSGHYFVNLQVHNRSASRGVVVGG